MDLRVCEFLSLFGSETSSEMFPYYFAVLGNTLMRLLKMFWMKTSPLRLFLVATASTKKVAELCCLSAQVHHSESSRSVTFSFMLNFIAKTQNPSVSDDRFDGFSVPSVEDFIDDDSDEMTLPV